MRYPLEMPSSTGLWIGSWALLFSTGALLLGCERAPPWNGIAEDPEPRSAGRIRSLAASHLQVCALYNDGGVACWGHGAELALGRSIPEGTAARVEGVTGARRLAVGDCSACALDDGGHMTCWGHSGHYCEPGGALLLPKPQRITRIPKMRVIADLHGQVTGIGEDGEWWRFGEVCASYSASPGSSGGLACRGLHFRAARQSHDGSPYGAFVRAAGRDAADLALGEMVCARDASGRARCYSGHITRGDGQSTRPIAALQAPEETVTRMSAGLDNICFVLASGTVECRSSKGIVIPKLPAPARTAVVCGSLGCATGQDGSLMCWKDPPYGTDQPVFTPELHTHNPAAGVRLVVATGIDFCTLATDDTVTCWKAFEFGDQERRRITLP